ncbi:MAG: MerR family transcriptional regulator [Pseudomonadota bacterium]
MKISEAAARCGLSVHTIRYYEAAGLCPPIARGADGQRRFAPRDVEWLTLIAALRETGMPGAEMRRFAAAYARGDTALAERKAILQAHARRLAEAQAVLARCADLVTAKLARYDARLGAE